jgi:hypothetical protein
MKPNFKPGALISRKPSVGSVGRDVRVLTTTLEIEYELVADSRGS